VGSHCWSHDTSGCASCGDGLQGAFESRDDVGSYGKACVPREHVGVVLARDGRRAFDDATRRYRRLRPALARSHRMNRTMTRRSRLDALAIVRVAEITMGERQR
jgi:hypothetical protein